MSENEGEDYCEHEEHVVYQAAEAPTWQFDPWNIVGIAVTTVGGILGTIGGVFSVTNQGLNMVANECWAHARWRKDQREAEEQAYYEEVARAEMAEAAERLAGMDDFWLIPPDGEATT